MAAQRILRLAVAVMLAGSLGVSLAGCIGPVEPQGEPTNSSRPTNTRSATPTPPPVPTLKPSGTAADNLPYFDYINNATFAANGFVEGVPYIDALVSAGFDRNAMSLTWWDTPDGHYADSIFFSVQFAGECLVGQIAAWGYQGEVLPILSTGSCMIGDYLQPIDW